MADKKFKRGDVVKLKSGGPDMTVVDYVVSQDLASIMYNTDPKPDVITDVVKVTWFEKNNSKRNEYHEDILDLVKAS